MIVLRGGGAGPQSEAPAWTAAERLPVEPELSRDRAADFRDADPDVDLDGAEHGEVVHHAALVADVAARDRLCLLGRGGIRHGAGEDRVGSQALDTHGRCTLHGPRNRGLDGERHRRSDGARRRGGWEQPPPGPGETVTSYWTMACPASVVAITVVRPGATPIRNRLVGEAG